MPPLLSTSGGTIAAFLLIALMLVVVAMFTARAGESRSEPGSSGVTYEDDSDGGEPEPRND
jgi:hypothetical protein